jgi:CubicO group peptidase (beta-lactamase class C family)
VVSTALHVCVDRGLLDYDDRVADHWPEFAQHGKHTITVRQVLCHEAGLYDVASIIERPEDVLEWDTMVAGLERMKPAFEPGTYNGYHAVTFGFLVGELVRRVSGHGISEFVQTQLAEPLDLDGCYVGLPADQHDRVVQLRQPEVREMREELKIAEALGLTIRPDVIAAALPPALLEGSNDPLWLERPMPSGNGCFTARSLARLYACLTCGGSLDGTRLLSPETIARATEVQNDRPDLVLAFPMMWRLGYHGVMTTAGVVERGFGHNGFGGSGAWGDLDRELGLALTLSSLGSALAGDTRFLRIGGAAIQAVDAARTS